MKKLLLRELYVVTHAQQRWVRLVKYPVFLCLAALLYSQYGWHEVVVWTSVALVIGLALHFLLRWKTNGWKTSWGPYRAICIPEY